MYCTLLETEALIVQEAGTGSVAAQQMVQYIVVELMY
jgi:hypothetical protein